MDSRRKKFCLVSQYWSPDIVGDAARVQQVVEGLERLNCDVTVITTQPHYPRGDRRGMKFRWMSASYEGRVLVFRLGMPALSHSGFGNRFLLYSWFAGGSFLPSVVLGRGSIHWAFSQRVFSSYPAMLMRFFFRRKVISDVTDVWPEAVVNTGLMAPNSTDFKVGRAAAKVAYLTSSRITTMTEKMRSFLATKYGISPGKVSIIPYGGRRLNVVDHPSSGRFTVLYFGNLGPAYDFEVVLRAASQMSDVSFVIRGDGEDLGKLQKQKQDMSLANLTFMPAPLSDVELSSLVSEANALVLPMKKPFYPDVSFPGKLIEYIQTGRPTILVGGGYPADLVDRYQVGLTVASGDHKGLAAAIARLKGDTLLLNRLSGNARRVAAAEFGERAVDDSLSRLLAAVA
jgi:putative colanic acid biosynthesis glycosyltransferase WcaI